MSEIRALIVDDEPLARRGIRQLLSAYPDITVVGECRDGRDAVRALAPPSPAVDLVFLDVQMPGLDGFAVIRTHGVARMPLTVFVTAHDEFAVRAFETQALDYLVKPLSEARFRATMTRVRERIRVHDAAALAARLSAVLNGAPAPGATATIAVPTDDGERLIDVREIDWISAEDDHAGIHAGGRRYRVRASLATLEARLDAERFLRVHRAAIVQVDRVREWRAAGDSESEAVLILRDGTELPVSRRRLAQVKARLRA